MGKYCKTSKRVHFPTRHLHFLSDTGQWGLVRSVLFSLIQWQSLFCMILTSTVGCRKIFVLLKRIAVPFKMTRKYASIAKREVFTGKCYHLIIELLLLLLPVDFFRWERLQNHGSNGGRRGCVKRTGDEMKMGCVLIIEPYDSNGQFGGCKVTLERDWSYSAPCPQRWRFAMMQLNLFWLC